MLDLTPSARKFADERRARLARIAEKAIPDRGICLRPAPPVVVPAAMIVPAMSWEDRQRQIKIVTNPPEDLFLEPWFYPRRSSVPSFLEIQVAVAAHYNVARSDMLSARREKGIVLPRQVAMYLAKMLTPHGLPMIGRHSGKRDHTTVLHAVRKIAALVDSDHAFAADLEIIKSAIKETVG